ncbi:hypothetical protein ZWY2020_031862 [Hordeum vulgare]|nr:hypothetical protein ZWY2020_031862 [Hordeum vulgare]
MVSLGIVRVTRRLHILESYGRKGDKSPQWQGKDDPVILIRRMDFVKYLKGGFSVQFPQTETPLNYIHYINRCIDWSFRDPNGEPLFSTGISIKNRIMDILYMDFRFWACIFGVERPYNSIVLYIRDMVTSDDSLYHKLPPILAMWILTWIVVLCRYFAAANILVQLLLVYQHA